MGRASWRWAELVGGGRSRVEMGGAGWAGSEPYSNRDTSPPCGGSFAAESEAQKTDWVEALQEALCDYEVVDKVWSNAPNRSCADCGAAWPEWASVNLGVVICKMCAGKGGGRGDARMEGHCLSVCRPSSSSHSRSFLSLPLFS